MIQCDAYVCLSQTHQLHPHWLDVHQAVAPSGSTTEQGWLEQALLCLDGHLPFAKGEGGRGTWTNVISTCGRDCVSLRHAQWLVIMFKAQSMEFTTIFLLQTVFGLMVVEIMSVLFQVSFVYDFCWPNFGRDHWYDWIPLEWRYHSHLKPKQRVWRVSPVCSRLEHLDQPVLMLWGFPGLSDFCLTT